MFLPTKNALKRAIALSLTGTRGGLVRLKIIIMLEKSPQNINQISKRLCMDYKTIQHHIRVLEKSGLIKSSSYSYNNSYALSTLLMSNKDTLKELCKLGKSR